VFNSFVVYPGVAHSITPEMFEDIFEFFMKNKRAKSMSWLPLLLED
jgi:hypothetical protein